MALLVIILFALPLNAQHSPLVSQYMFNQLLVNPAYAGSRDVLSLTGIVRRQWIGLPGAPQTESFYLHSPLKDPRNNLGLGLIHDKIGVSSSTSIQGYYAFRIDMGEKKGRLSFGLQGGASLLQNQYSKVVTDMPSDQVFAADSPLLTVPRLGFGLYYDQRSWYFGLSAPYLLHFETPAFKAYYGNSLLFKPYMAMGGFLVKLNPDLWLRPSFLAKYIKGVGPQVDLNANLIIKESVWIGASYRSGDGIVGLFEYQISPQFRFGYAFDYGFSALQGYNKGSHEFMLRYEFGYKHKAISPRYF